MSDFINQQQIFSKRGTLTLSFISKNWSNFYLEWKKSVEIIINDKMILEHNFGRDDGSWNFGGWYRVNQILIVWL